MNYWLITDTHFNHDNIQSYCRRPPDWKKLVIDNWRKLVQRDDVVIHLGDVIIGKRQRLLPLIGWLPGTKILIRGNHDNEAYDWYLRNGFNFACESIVFREVLFTHKPAPELPSNARLNVHGHLHNFAETNHRAVEASFLKPFNKLLAIEYTEYAPVLLEDFIGQDFWKGAEPKTENEFPTTLCADEPATGVSDARDPEKGELDCPS